ncbi:MAG: sulfatase [Spirochaetes bacterium]|nr:sulfatase [Spirochaetota bacterium]
MKRPNFVFILMDDMGVRDLSCYGSTFYETPNIDALASEGMRFTNAYAACPVCSPTRASVMTGKYPARLGVTDWIDHGNFHPCRGKLIDAPYVKELPLEEKNIARVLNGNGYHTWHVGKWHLGLEPFWPEQQGFDVNVGGCHMGCPWHGYFAPWKIPTLTEGRDGDYLGDRLTDEAIALIRDKNDDRPFFLNWWMYEVHTPINAKPGLIEKYKAKAKKLGLDAVKALEEGEYFPCEHKKEKRVTRRIVQSDPAYAAMIETVDINVGRLIAALKDTGEYDNTVIIFTSDNGGLATAESSPTCNAPYSEGKGWGYEGGVREPLIITGPGVRHAACDVTVTSTDFFPTMLSMAGLPLIPEQHKDGVDIVPLLTGGTSLAREAIYWHYPHYGNQGGTPCAAVRCGQWKLIEFYEDWRAELYDLANDVSEKHNVADANPDMVKKLRGMLSAWRYDVAAVLPQPNPER